MENPNAYSAVSLAYGKIRPIVFSIQHKSVLNSGIRMLIISIIVYDEVAGYKLCSQHIAPMSIQFITYLQSALSKVFSQYLTL